VPPWGRVLLGILVSLFLAVFGLDALDEGIAAFVLHLTPALLLLLVVAVSWRREWVGGTVFVALAVLYAVMDWHRPDWVLSISGPLIALNRGGLGVRSPLDRL
jgi:hypothetical protein